MGGPNQTFEIIEFQHDQNESFFKDKLHVYIINKIIQGSLQLAKLKVDYTMKNVNEPPTFQARGKNPKRMKQ